MPKCMLTEHKSNFNLTTLVMGESESKKVNPFWRSNREAILSILIILSFMFLLKYLFTMAWHAKLN